MKSKLLSIALVLALLFTFALPAFADQPAAAAALDIKLKIGSNQMTVNGKASKITPPYQSGGTPMVPLAVVTKALGAKLTLKGAKTITLTYLKHTVVVTIGSKSATFDGKKVTLPVAPAAKSNVTMVPIKVIEGLGAKVAYNSATKEIGITAADSAGGNGGSGSAIDSDAGKSKIGDSFYRWSMNYPTGLVQDFQSEDGDVLVFRDVKKEYYLAVYVEEPDEELDAEDVRETIYEYLEDDETIVDKRSANGPAGSYEKVTVKNRSGFYYEYRGIQKNGCLYILIFGKKAAGMKELQASSVLLDSFKPSFDPVDGRLKDLTKIKNGVKTLKNDDFGLSVSLPKEWISDSDSSLPWFYAEDAYFYLEVTSTVKGDTVDAWIDRKMKRFEDYFAAPYRKAPEKSDVTWNGIPAKMVKLSYSQDTITWWEEYEIFAVSGEYRYYTELAYSEKNKSKYGALLGSILNSMKVDFKVVENNFGNIPDESDEQDLTVTVTKTSKEFGYSLTVPKHWSLMSGDMEGNVVNFYFPGGSLSVLAFEDLPDSKSAIEEIRKKTLDLGSNSDKYKVIEDTTATFAGKTAKKLVIEDTRNLDKSPNWEIGYIFEHNGVVYVVNGSYYLANGTDFVKQQLETAINSFKLNS